MGKISLFDGIKEDKTTLLRCFSPSQHTFTKGETILDFSENDFSYEKVNILISGRAHLYSIDLEGRYALIETYEENDLFGKIFLNTGYDLNFIIVAAEKCEILKLNYLQLTRVCENGCPDHVKLLSNLLRISVSKAEQLSTHLSILSMRSIRGKLLAYLKNVSNGRKSFTINYKISELADYLSVDRCAMLRELKNMRDDGIIDSKGRTFTFL